MGLDKFAETIIDLSDGVVAIRDLVEVVREAAKLLDRARPDYIQAAKEFQEIAVILRNYTSKFKKFLQDYRDFDFTEANAKTRYRVLWDRIHGKKLEDVARDFQFKCSAIDSLYHTRCMQDLKGYYGHSD